MNIAYIQKRNLMLKIFNLLLEGKEFDLFSIGANEFRVDYASRIPRDFDKKTLKEMKEIDATYMSLLDDEHVLGMSSYPSLVYYISENLRANEKGGDILSLPEGNVAVCTQKRELYLSREKFDFTFHIELAKSLQKNPRYFWKENGQDSRLYSDEEFEQIIPKYNASLINANDEEVDDVRLARYSYFKYRNFYRTIEPLGVRVTVE